MLLDVQTVELPCLKVQSHDEYHQERFCLEGTLNKSQQYLHLKEAEWRFQSDLSSSLWRLRVALSGSVLLKLD